MSTGGRVALSILSFILSMILTTIVGVILYSMDIRGPRIGYDYLTEWENWKYISGLASALLTTFVYLRTGRKRKGEQEPTSSAPPTA